MITRTTEVTEPASLALNPAVQEALDTIVREMVEAQASITGARPAQSELQESYQRHLQHVGELRGRPPLYPYIGAGLGKGPLVVLADGSVKWDMINGIGVH